MLLNHSNRLYMPEGEYYISDIIAEQNKDFRHQYTFLKKDFSFTSYVNHSVLNNVDMYAITTKSGHFTVLPGSYERHTKELKTNSISTLEVGDDLLLAGCYPDVKDFILLRASQDLCEVEYFELNEDLAQIFAIYSLYGTTANTSSSDIVIRDIKKEHLSDGAILFIKNFGGVVLSNISSSSTTYTIKITDPLFVSFFVDNASDIMYMINLSPRSVIKAYLDIYFDTQRKGDELSLRRYTGSIIKNILFSRFGIISEFNYEEHSFKFNDFMLNLEAVPMHERYKDVIKINDAFSVYKDEIVSIKKSSGSAVNVLIEDQSDSRLIADNIF